MSETKPLTLREMALAIRSKVRMATGNAMLEIATILQAGHSTHNHNSQDATFDFTASDGLTYTVMVIATQETHNKLSHRVREANSANSANSNAS